MINPSHQKPRAPRLASLLLITPVLVLAVSGQSFAQSGLQDCAGIKSDSKRLACYDRASQQTLAVAPEVAQEPARLAMTAPRTQALSGDPAPGASSTSDSLIDTAWGFDPSSARYLIDVYRPNYLLLGRYSTRPNEKPFNSLFNVLDNPDAEINSTEAEFQISFKARLWATENRRVGIWGAYTQQSQWQIYNDELSRPFRETNYQPELMVSAQPDVSVGGVTWKLFNFGYNHQSNGRSDPISRSWDRLVMEFGIESGNFALLLRPWIVLNDGDDDNPNITDYYGYGDITAIYKWRGHSFTLMGRGNPDADKGAARLTWTSPPLIGPLRGYVTAFTGYGESMIDYNWKQNTFGIGITLNDLL